MRLHYLSKIISMESYEIAAQIQREHTGDAPKNQKEKGQGPI